MISNQFILDVHPELIIDNFAGGGGASTGIELALGRHVDIAINHDPEAVAMHSANHPQTRHYCESVWEVNPLEVTQGRPVGLVWLSPDCKHFSKAKGGKPVEKKIRGLAWVALRWAAKVKPRVIMLENVEEFVTWGPLAEGQDGKLYPCPKRKGRDFHAFCNALRKHGYTVEHRELRACDYGAPTIRKRLFLIARCDGQPIVWPAPTHGDPKSAAVKAKKLKPWRTAAECIDWSIPCPSIFERKRPLADATCRRIAKGIMRYVVNATDPFIVGVGGRMGQSRPRGTFEPIQTLTGKADSALVMPTIIPVTHQGADRVESLDEPMRTITGAHRGEKALAAACITRIGQTGGNGSYSNDITDPLRTIVSKNEHLLVAPYLTPYYSDKRPSDARGTLPNEPIKTITTENRHAVVSAFLAKHYTGVVGSELNQPAGTVTSVDHHSLVTSHIAKLRGENIGHGSDEPLHTVSAGGTHHAEVRAFLIKYYGNEKEGIDITEPLHTITSRDRFGLVTIEGEQYAITDIGLRMLSPRELYKAQGFPDSYVIGDQPEQGLTLTKSAQVRMCGNSVCPPLATALVRANIAEIAIRRRVA